MPVKTTTFDRLPDPPGVAVGHVADRADAGEEAVAMTATGDPEECQEELHQGVEQLPPDGLRMSVGAHLLALLMALGLLFLLLVPADEEGSGGVQRDGREPVRYGAWETLSEKCAGDSSDSFGSPSCWKERPFGAR